MANPKKNFEELKTYLEPDEKPVCTIAGLYEGKVMGYITTRKGIMSATNKRLMFYGKKLFGYDMEVFPYSNISSIEISKGFFGHAITLFAAGNIVKIRNISAGDVNKFISTVRSRIGSKEEVKESV